jgi:hypothetical protein
MNASALFEQLSARSRAAKLALLRRLIGDNPAPRVLDLGGQVESAGPLLDMLPRAAHVTLVNLMPAQVARVRASGLPVRALAADARALPFRDGAFDLVYSNAVIEHLGSEANQRSMAAEIQRVGRSWFVTTPNRWFPFELHTRLPFVSWLPAALLHRCAAVYSYNHFTRRYTRGNDQSDLLLLSARSLRGLFPSSRLVKNRITLWPETLIVYGGAQAWEGPPTRA